MSIESDLAGVSLSEPDNLISVIVPVFNTEKYLPACIESILAQTFPVFELLLIDDGSTDGSLDICKGFAERDCRIKVFRQVNRGVSSARNKGISQARGKFITFIDSDDVVDREYLHKLFAAINESASVKDSIAVCGVKQERYTGKAITLAENYGHLTGYKSSAFSMASFMEDALTVQFLCIGVRTLIPASLIRENELGFENCKFHEDQLFFFDLIHCTQEVRVCEEPLYFYRHVETSASHALYRKWLIEDTEVYLDLLCDRVNSYIFPPEEREMIIELAIMNSKIDTIKNLYLSPDFAAEKIKLKKSTFFDQEVSSRCVALWKKHNSLFSKVVFFLAENGLLFLMPAFTKFKGRLKKLIQTVS